MYRTERWPEEDPDPPPPPPRSRSSFRTSSASLSRHSSLKKEKEGKTKSPLNSAPATATSTPKKTVEPQNLEFMVTGKQIVKRFVERVEEVLRGERAVTLVLDDPAGNSYVQSLARDPAAPDAGLKITRYTRSYEQNEELGLNDMRTEDYRPSPSRSPSRSPASECAAS